MVKYVSDPRFQQRPHYKPEELDRECETIISSFLRDLHGTVAYPVTTEDLTKLIERDAESLDLYADLSGYGNDIEGVTEFNPGRRPRVLIAAALSEEPSRENRLRTTLTHEYGHVRFHAYLWELEAASGDLLRGHPNLNKGICKRDGMLHAGQTDWMEWQAGHICGALLMPKSPVLQLYGQYCELHGFEGSLSEDAPHAPGWIQEVTNAFKVSGEAAKIRAIKLGLLTQGPQASPLF